MLRLFVALDLPADVRGGLATWGARAAAAEMAVSSIPVRATNSGMAIPNSDSRTRRAMRAAGSGEANTARRDARQAEAPAPLSTTMPPPMVVTGENLRMMKRSPGSSSAGSRRIIRTQALAPGWSARADESPAPPKLKRRTWASISAVPE